MVIPITLMSFNTQHCMNYLTKAIDFDCFVEEIRLCNADIIGLNEMRDKGESKDYQEQTKILADKLGYDYYFAKAIDFDGVDPYGNGIISRFPIVSAETILVPDPEVRAYNGYYETRCLLKVRIDVCGGLDVCVTHFGLNPDEQKNAVDTVLANISDQRCVLMGDFNLTPDNRLLDPIRERMYDTASLFAQELLSFPSDAPKKKIDYIFTSCDIKVLRADIPGDVVSDHRPHIAVIESICGRG
ncbi:MAG: endonuclease/exonuclease/phosphatase family protein [Lachnospiraceae bacterium]|nr:endonuclease/exonuclease/phosphatase family protein [Lachnospiraceae bacterium]